MFPFLLQMHTIDTGLKFWEWTKLLVLQSGDVLVYGIKKALCNNQASEKITPVPAPRKRPKTKGGKAKNSSTWQGNGISLESAAFHLFTKGGVLSKSMEPSCCSNDVKNIALVSSEEKEYLVLSCLHCQKLFLFNICNGDLKSAFSRSGFIPGPMCSSEDTLYVMNMMHGASIIFVLDCSCLPFILKGMIQTGLENIHSMCYMIGPSEPILKVTTPLLDRSPRATHRSLLKHKEQPIQLGGKVVLTSIGGQLIKAFDCETKGVTWEVKATIKGQTVQPHGVCFCQYGVLIADGQRNRLLIVTSAGQIIEQVHIGHLGGAAEIFQNMGELVILCRNWRENKDTYKVVFTSLEVRLRSVTAQWEMMQKPFGVERIWFAACLTEALFFKTCDNAEIILDP